VPKARGKLLHRDLRIESVVSLYLVDKGETPS